MLKMALERGRKIKKLFLFLASLLFCVLSYSGSCSAEFMPPVVPSQQTLSFLPDFLVSCMQTDMANGGTYVDAKSLKDILLMQTGQSVQESMQTKYVDVGSSDWGKDISVPFWDSSGNLVPNEDVICAFVSSNAGNCSYCYSKTTGEILLQGTTFNNAESTCYGGQGVNLHPDSGKIDTPLSYILPVDTYLLQSNGVVVEAGTPQDIKEAYENFEFSGYFWANGTNRGVFVPNGCCKDCVILPFNNSYTFEGTSNAFGSTPVFYCNSYSDVEWYGVIDQPTQNYFTRGTVVYGDSFTYAPHYVNGFNELWSGGTVAWKAPTQAQYERMKNYSASYTVPSVVNNYNEYVSYDKLLETSPTINEITNNNFDYSSKITNNNYPISYNITYPDYSPITNNYYETIKNYYEKVNNPGVEPNPIPVPDDFNNINLPIFNNLQKRFPFSIPWDIYNMLSVLDTERIPPTIDISFTFPVINYTWNFVIDFALFTTTAEIFRTCFLISFIIGLAMFSYSHFFGS